jgi:uncharacterized UBP type Zn finger protein
MIEVLCPYCLKKMIETDIGDQWAEYSCEQCKCQKVVMRKTEQEFQRLPVGWIADRER